MNNFEILKEFLDQSKKLAEHSNMMENATGYHKDKFNYAYYAHLRLKVIKELEEGTDDRRVKK